MFQGFECPIFIKEFLANDHKYGHLKAEVRRHLRTCRICAREYERLGEEMRQWEEDDKPGFRH